MEKTKNTTKTVLLTGGHAGTTALAVIQRLKKDPEYNFDIHWIGVKKATEASNMETLEYRIFPSLGVHFHNLRVGRLQRKWTRHTLLALTRVPGSFFHAFSLIRKIKPEVIVSFGGSAALPVVIAGWILRIPIILHEQTSAVGLANKLSSRFVNKIAIARDGSRMYFPKNKTVLTGNPIVEEVLSVEPKTKIGNPPVIYISTGSRAAQNVNIAILDILEDLLKNFRVEHISGDLDYEKFKAIRRNLPKQLEERYTLHSFVDPLHLGRMYKDADIVIGRGGANTIAEIIATKRPSVLIPIPWTRYDEQTKNAKLAEDAGIAVVLHQNDLKAQTLLQAIQSVHRNWEGMVKKSDSRLSLLDREASLKMVNLIKSLLK